MPALRSISRIEPRALAPAERAADVTSADRELALRVQRDPIGHAAQVHERFAGDVNRLVWHLLGADPDHNDIVQQVFYKVLARVDRLREPEKIRGWVLTITTNAVYEELRRREVRRICLGERRPVEFHADLAHDVEVRDLLTHARAVLDRLPAKERVVFVLHFVEGLTLGEVAETCGYSMATAKRRLRAANRRFRKLVERTPDLLRMLDKAQEQT
jgi:RNA polymerase sigma-70 factor, ECF subfamily